MFVGFPFSIKHPDVCTNAFGQSELKHLVSSFHVCIEDFRRDQYSCSLPPYVYVLAKRLICAFVFCGYESFGMFTYVSMRVLQKVELLRHSCR